MPPFSRLQLAAALIEYDNDPDDPDGPYRSAEESAIFLFLKGRPQPRKTLMGYDEMPRRSVDFLGVALPGETEGPTTLGNQQYPSNADADRQRSVERLAGGRKTPDGRRSVEPLVRPLSELARLNGSMFRGGDGEYSEEEDEVVTAGPELNLASWGIDNFLAKEQPRARSRASSIDALNAANTVGEGPRPRADSRASSNALQDANVPGGNRRSLGNRSQSMGDWGGRPSSELEPWEVARTSAYPTRPRASSIADPTEIAARQQHPPVVFRSHSRAGSVMSMSGQQAIVFPSTTTPGVEASPNPFELPPSAGNASRFDPKTIAHQRNVSIASLSTRYALPEGGNGGFNDNASVMTGAIPQPGSSRFSRIDLLRPKVLIMPTLLQDAPEEAPPPPKPVRDGFMESTDARPLPPGAKTARTSAYGNGFGVNPRSSMTLSQLTFRNSLMVGGQRDPAYADLEENLRRAEKEGEIIQQEVDLEPEFEETVPHRAAGKLYGRSLIDDLEARKAQLKSKQRVFRGDERPSMMQRAQPTRTSTLIDAQALQKNAQGAILRPELHRNPSSKEPLLNFAGDPIPGTTVQARVQMGRSGGLPNSRSVFGVDQVWEKELAKLQQIEAIEKAEEEERKRVEAEQLAREEAKAAKKAAKRAKGKNKPLLDIGLNSNQYVDQGGVLPISRAPEAPPLLPSVDPFAMPPKAAESSDSDSDADPTSFNKAASRMQNSKSQQDWLSDDERQVAAARPRPRPRTENSTPARNISRFAAGLHVTRSDSEDSDVPLTSALAKAKQRQQAEDSEEDKPLATVLSNSLSALDFGGTLLADVKKSPEPKLSMPQPRPALRNVEIDDDGEDDQPLGLRASKFGLGGGDDDDEKPLGMRYSTAPSQLFAQQQQQQAMMQQQQMMQQQMMAAAQMRGSMFNPMMMGNMNMGMAMGYGNSMGMPGMMAMQGPQVGVMDAGPADPAKLSAVDRWRRGVGGAEG